MPRIVLFLTLLVHGLIHFLGFAKAFSIFETPNLSYEIGKIPGALWLFTTLLLVYSATLLIIKHDRWWLSALIALPLSQGLIISSWHDSKIGTLANIFILLSVIAGYCEWSYRKFYLDLADKAREKEAKATTEMLTEESMTHLPPVVQNYIRQSGALNKPVKNIFKVHISGQLRKNEESEWMYFKSEQVNTLKNPARIFWLYSKMSMIPVTGVHYFINGKAVMDIRLLSALKVQFQSGREMDIAETVTYLNDLCIMNPGGLTDSRITWKEEDSLHVQAIFKNGDISVRAMLVFNERSELIDFISDDRYMHTEESELKKARWSTPLSDYTTVNGTRFASRAKTIWKFPDKDFCYGIFKIESIE